MAHAGLITDNGDTTTVDQVEWLDWTKTVGLTQVLALQTFGEFRLATTQELTHMMTVFFGVAFTAQPGYHANDGSVQVRNKITDFVSLFGDTTPSISTDATGAYVNDRFWAVDRGNYYHNMDPANFPNRAQYIQTTGIAMVRRTEVPEPTTLAIFALGMIGLASRRFKKQS